MNISHARSLAWKFNKTSGIEFDELLGEACLAGLKAEVDPKYDESRANRDTFVYMRMRRRLLNFINKRMGKEHLQLAESIDIEGEDGETLDLPWEAIPYERTPASEVIFMDCINSLSEVAQEAFFLLNQAPSQYMNMGSKKARGDIKRCLRSRGWSWPKIRHAFSELKELSDELPKIAKE